MAELGPFSASVEFALEQLAQQYHPSESEFFSDVIARTHICRIVTSHGLAQQLENANRGRSTWRCEDGQRFVENNGRACHAIRETHGDNFGKSGQQEGRSQLDGLEIGEQVDRAQNCESVNVRRQNWMG